MCRISPQSWPLSSLELIPLRPAVFLALSFLCSADPHLSRCDGEGGGDSSGERRVGMGTATGPSDVNEEGLVDVH